MEVEDQPHTDETTLRALYICYQIWHLILSNKILSMTNKTFIQAANDLPSNNSPFLSFSPFLTHTYSLN